MARSLAGITSLAEGFTCLTGAILFLLLGESLEPRMLLPVMTGSLLSVPFAANVVRRVTQTGMRYTIAALTTALGAMTVYNAL